MDSFGRGCRGWRFDLFRREIIDMAIITLRGGKQVDVNPSNAGSVADDAVDAIHKANRQTNTPDDLALDTATRRAVFNAANGTGGSVSGVDVPDETPVDYFSVVENTITGSAQAVSAKAKEIAPGLPSLDKLTNVVALGFVVAGLGVVAYFVYRFSK